MEKWCRKTKNKDACIQKWYWRGKTGTWIQPFLSFTGKMEATKYWWKEKYEGRFWKRIREQKNQTEI